MNAVGLIFKPWRWIAGKLFTTWARPAIQPDNPADYLPDADTAICYVLETGGLADTLALDRACRIHGMPSPTSSLVFGDARENRRIVVMRRMQGLLFRRKRATGSMRLKRLVKARGNSEAKELLLIPVAIYWGRSPDKEGSLLKLLFSENWDMAGRTRKFFATMLHGRNTLLRFSEPATLSSIVSADVGPEVAYRKVSRILRVHFRQRRTATLGPDLSHRRTLVNQVMMNPRVGRVIKAESNDNRALLERKTHKARKYAQEIAAHISYPTVRVILLLLRRVWNRVYDGIVLNHVERLHQVARDKEIVYAPCHRSHFDYLLLGYIVHEQGLSLPHTAAGINLNMPIVGAILRRGGAFYLRRSFKGNRLYAAVFNAYLHEILKRGHSIEYFVEGTRSRTGRLLAPKAGMLAMTVHSYMQNPRRPLVFMPIYFGYEKLIEGDSFISELGGAEKKKETLVGLIRSVRALRKDFGKVYVNVGEPVAIEPILDNLKPDWRGEMENEEERPAWMNEIIDELGARIMTGINSAAAVTPISLLATVLLSTPKQSIGELELCRQLAMSLCLLEKFRYSDSVTLPDWSPEEIIAHGEKLGVISRSSHPLGDVLHMAEHEAVLMTYFRNNVQHLFAIPASIACCFIQGRRLEHTELQRLIRLIYPFMKEELCLKWEYEEIDDVTTAGIKALLDLEILTSSKDGKVLIRPPAGSGKAYQLLMLGQSMVPMLQRFYLVISLLVEHGSGVLSRARLERLCQQSAQRLTMIYGLHSPDFFDRALFHDFIRTLREQSVLRRNNGGLLEFDEDINSIGEDARLVLGEEIRHSILSLTFSDGGEGPGT
ncbi:MAG: glycerol-3-phosphate 1-O-acyltransferase PlsB [Woeseia sp.]